MSVMRDLLRLAAHITGIALTITLIPLAAVLTVFVHPVWGGVCLGAALTAVWFAARLDHRAHKPRRDPVDAHFADVARALHEPTMRLPAATGQRRPEVVPAKVPPPPPPPPPRALTGQDAAVPPGRLPFGVAVYPGQTAPEPWFPHTEEVPHA